MQPEANRPERDRAAIDGVAAPAGRGAPAERFGGAPAPVPITVALRRVVVGFRVVSALWAVALGVIAVGSADVSAGEVAGPVMVAVGWAVLTVVVERAGDLADPRFLVADVAVAAALVFWQGGLVGDGTTFLGGYPFSSVVLVAAVRGTVPGLGAAVVLSLASILAPGATLGSAGQGRTASTVLLYLFGAATVAWSAAVIRSHDARQRSTELALAEERARRVRSQERAETAAHLHDSVLQILALIQRRADDPAAVARLARRQERSLRAWLADDDRASEVSPVTRLEALVAEVEDLHEVTVELVTVGHAPATPGTAALVAAVGEAVTNAARHAGVAEVSVFWNATPSSVQAFVRDRGAGFDPDAVDGSRHGIRDSIRGRLARHGGHAVLLTAPGKGTEWELSAPLDAPANDPAAG